MDHLLQQTVLVVSKAIHSKEINVKLVAIRDFQIMILPKSANNVQVIAKHVLEKLLPNALLA
jgi:hypothetical protein